jgi:hypothetical protein
MLKNVWRIYIVEKVCFDSKSHWTKVLYIRYNMMNLLKKNCKFAPYKTVHEYTYIFLDSYKKTINSDEVINKSGEVKPY